MSQEALNSFLKAAENLQVSYKQSMQLKETKEIRIHCQMCQWLTIVLLLSSSSSNEQVKGLSTEHGRLAAAQSQSHEQERRHQRNSSSATSPSALPINTMKQECDSLMNPSSSGLSGGFAPYIPQMYRPFDATRGKRNQRSPFSEPERQSVLRDGSRGSAENTGSSKRARYVFASKNCEKVHKLNYHKSNELSKSVRCVLMEFFLSFFCFCCRPSSSASSTAPTEADTLQNDRTSPQSRLVFENTHNRIILESLLISAIRLFLVI